MATPEAHHGKDPFHFWGCSEIRESLGIRADSERHLLERLETAPEESIYFHTVRTLQRRQVVPTPYPNDFASWVATEVRDIPLAERLALASPFEFDDEEAFREHLLTILDDHLSRMPFDPRSFFGRPFHFLRGHLVEVPLGVEATDLAGLRRGLAEVDEGAIYYHAIEAIGRLDKPRNDFAAWVDEVLGMPALADRLAAPDPFVLTLKGVRERLLAVVDEALEARAGP